MFVQTSSVCLQSTCCSGLDSQRESKHQFLSLLLYLKPQRKSPRYRLKLQLYSCYYLLLFGTMVAVLCLYTVDTQVCTPTHLYGLLIFYSWHFIFIWICKYLFQHILGTERAKTALHSPILYCLMTINKTLNLVSITLEECFSLHMIYSDRKSNFNNMIHCNLKWNQFNTDQLPRNRLHSTLIGLDIFTCWWLFDIKRSETLRGFR